MKASAGSGKTFRLALEYISLLMEDPQNYLHTLAVTFTNDATNEMKSRILSYLNELSSGKVDGDFYKELTKRNASWTADFIRKQASEALGHILHDYTHFQIRTIDSFFQTIVKSLGHDLNLPPNQQLIIDGKQVLEDAVDDFIEHASLDPDVLNGIIDLMKQRVREDKKVDVAKDLKQFGGLIFNEDFVSRRQEINERLSDKKFVDGYKQLLEEGMKELEKPTHYKEDFLTELERHSLTEKDFNRGKNITGAFQKIDDRNLDKVNTAYCDDETKWLKNTSPEAAKELVRSHLMRFFKEAYDKTKETLTNLNTLQLSYMYLSQMRLLNAIGSQVRKNLEATGSMLLSETPGLLYQLVEGEDSPFIFEKTGTQLTHVMIDEFQDTSKLQWENFQKVLNECLYNGNGSLLVGDVKQSIYRWRNSDWNLLNDMKEGGWIHLDPIYHNFRSSRRIVYFNNFLFPSIIHMALPARIEKEKAEDFAHTEYPKMSKAYSDVRQELKEDRPEEGYVNIRFFEGNAEEGSEWMRAAVRDQIVELHAHHVAYKDIVILVRKKRQIAELAEYLSHELPGVTIISDEAFKLKSSQAVQLLIAALRCISSPSDSTALLTLVSLYLQDVKQEKMDWTSLDTNHLTDLLPSRYVEVLHRKASRLLPLYELIEQLNEIFHTGDIPRQDAYLYTFYDQVTLYLQNNPSDIGSFLNYWDNTLSEMPAASDAADGIRLKTIHKSKGLEFHTVIIPYCNWKLDESAQLLCPPVDPPDYKEKGKYIPLLLMDYGKKMANSHYDDCYKKERIQQWVDNLNLLYVAFTRPKKNLYIIGQKSGSFYTTQSLIKETIERWETSKLETQKWELNPTTHLLTRKAENAQGTIENKDIEIKLDDEKLLHPWDVELKEDGKQSVYTYEYGTPVYGTKQEQKETDTADTPQIHIKSYSKAIEFRESNRSKDFIADQTGEETSSEYIERGKLFHTLFSSIHTLEDVDSALLQLEFEGVIGSESMKKDIEEAIHRLMENKQAKAWFSDEWTVRNEHNIILWKENKVSEQRPDRVMMKEDETVVVDFKFGLPQKSHVRQVEQYIALLREMGYPNVHGYLWYVLNGNKIQEVK